MGAHTLALPAQQHTTLQVTVFAQRVLAAIANAQHPQLRANLHLLFSQKMQTLQLAAAATSATPCSTTRSDRQVHCSKHLQFWLHDRSMHARVKSTRIPSNGQTAEHAQQKEACLSPDVITAACAGLRCCFLWRCLLSPPCSDPAAPAGTHHAGELPLHTGRLPERSPLLRQGATACKGDQHTGRGGEAGRSNFHNSSHSLQDHRQQACTDGGC